MQVAKETQTEQAAISADNSAFKASGGDEPGGSAGPATLSYMAFALLAAAAGAAVHAAL